MDIIKVYLDYALMGIGWPLRVGGWPLAILVATLCGIVMAWVNIRLERAAEWLSVGRISGIIIAHTFAWLVFCGFFQSVFSRAFWESIVATVLFVVIPGAVVMFLSYITPLARLEKPYFRKEIKFLAIVLLLACAVSLSSGSMNYARTAREGVSVLASQLVHGSESESVQRITAAIIKDMPLLPPRYRGAACLRLPNEQCGAVEAAGFFGEQARLFERAHLHPLSAPDISVSEKYVQQHAFFQGLSCLLSKEQCSTKNAEEWFREANEPVLAALAGYRLETADNDSITTPLLEAADFPEALKDQVRENYDIYRTRKAALPTEARMSRYGTTMNISVMVDKTETAFDAALLRSFLFSQAVRMLDDSVYTDNVASPESLPAEARREYPGRLWKLYGAFVIAFVLASLTTLWTRMANVVVCGLSNSWLVIQ